jgi:hypothetical protein
MDDIKNFKYIYSDNRTRTFYFLYNDNTADFYVDLYTTDVASRRISTRSTDIISKGYIDIYTILLKILKLNDAPSNHMQNYLPGIYNEMRKKNNSKTQNKLSMYSKLSLKKINNSENYYNLMNADLTNIPNTLAIIYTNINISDINFDNVKIKNHYNGEDTITSTTFKDYKQHYAANKEIWCTGGGLPIKTEQTFITHQNICYYLNNEDKNEYPPVLLEYEKNELYIVDGNNRIGYYILKGLATIPAIIIIQNPENVITSAVI